MIRLQNVSKHYTKGGTPVKALDDISLEIPQGALALVYGPSGSGKTTLVNLVAGLSRPSSGSITIEDRELTRMTPRQRAALRAQRIAVVFQMFHLVPYLTALENVLLPTLARTCPDALERAYELLIRLGLGQRMGHYPSELSVGEHQRCAMARAVLNRPGIILADEPTGNLDDESAGHVLDLLDQSRRDGATVLLVSHQHVDRITHTLKFHSATGSWWGRVCPAHRSF